MTGWWELVKVGEVLHSWVAKIFEVVYGEVIHVSDKWVAAVPDDLRIIKRSDEPPLDNPGGRVTSVGDEGGVLFS